MVLGRGAFGKWWGHEGRALMNGISVLEKETLETSLATFIMWGHSEKPAVYNLAEDSYQNLTMLAP